MRNTVGLMDEALVRNATDVQLCFPSDLCPVLVRGHLWVCSTMLKFQAARLEASDIFTVR